MNQSRQPRLQPWLVRSADMREVLGAGRRRAGLGHPWGQPAYPETMMLRVTFSAHLSTLFVTMTIP